MILLKTAGTKRFCDVRQLGSNCLNLSRGNESTSYLQWPCSIVEGCASMNVSTQNSLVPGVDLAEKHGVYTSEEMTSRPAKLR